MSPPERFMFDIHGTVVEKGNSEVYPGVLEWFTDFANFLNFCCYVISGLQEQQTEEGFEAFQILSFVTGSSFQNLNKNILRQLAESVKDFGFSLYTEMGCEKYYVWHDPYQDDGFAIQEANFGKPKTYRVLPEQLLTKMVLFSLNQASCFEIEKRKYGYNIRMATNNGFANNKDVVLSRRELFIQHFGKIVRQLGFDMFHDGRFSIDIVDSQFGKERALEGSGIVFFGDSPEGSQKKIKMRLDAMPNCNYIQVRSPSHLSDILRELHLHLRSHK